MASKYNGGLAGNLNGGNAQLCLLCSTMKALDLDVNPRQAYVVDVD